MTTFYMLSPAPCDGLPGSYWQGWLSTEEKNTLYKCTIREYKALHKYHDKSVGQGIELQELGEAEGGGGDGEAEG